MKLEKGRTETVWLTVSAKGITKELRKERVQVPPNACRSQSMSLSLAMHESVCLRPPLTNSQNRFARPSSASPLALLSNIPILPIFFLLLQPSSQILLYENPSPLHTVSETNHQHFANQLYCEINTSNVTSHTLSHPITKFCLQLHNNEWNDRNAQMGQSIQNSFILLAKLLSFALLQYV